MKWTVTKALIIATPIIWIAWDIYAAIAGGNASTESAQIWRWSYEYGSLPFAWGLLSGHLFCQIRAPSSDTIAENAISIAAELLTLALAAAWIAWDIASGGRAWPTTVLYSLGHYPAIPLLGGIAAGYLACQMYGPTAYPQNDPRN